jgi:hypothetical protein
MVGLQVTRGSRRNEKILVRALVRRKDLGQKVEKEIHSSRSISTAGVQLLPRVDGWSLEIRQTAGVQLLPRVPGWSLEILQTARGQEEARPLLRGRGGLSFDLRCRGKLVTDMAHHSLLMNSRMKISLSCLAQQIGAPPLFDSISLMAD